LNPVIRHKEQKDTSDLLCVAGKSLVVLIRPGIMN